MRWVAVILFLWMLIQAHAGTVWAAKGSQGRQIIALPKPRQSGTMSVEEAIARRRSHRTFAAQQLNWEQLGQLLWAGQGVTTEKFGVMMRAVPSAGALYPLELYVATATGLYQYLPARHEVIPVLTDDIRPALSRAAMGQGGVRQAAAVFIICAEYSRVTRRYGERGVLYAQLEAGHAAQNIHLQAVSLGLVSFPVGAFKEEDVRAVLNAPAEYVPLYIIPVGYPE